MNTGAVLASLFYIFLIAGGVTKRNIKKTLQFLSIGMVMLYLSWCA